MFIYLKAIIGLILWTIRLMGQKEKTNMQDHNQRDLTVFTQKYKYQ